MSKDFQSFKDAIGTSIVDYLPISDIYAYKFGRLDTIIAEGIDRDGDRIHVKFAKDWLAIEELIFEARSIGILSNKLQVPSLVSFHLGESAAILITKSIKGIPAHEYDGSIIDLVNSLVMTIEHFINIFADISGIGIGVNHELDRVERCLRLNEVNIESFVSVNQGLEPIVALNNIRDKIQYTENNCFSHGDFCLPNVLVMADGKIGLVDLGNAGIGEPSRDIASMIGSLSRNFGEDAAILFQQNVTERFGENSMANADAYNLINQFFYHRNLANNH